MTDEPGLWVATLLISERTAAKLRSLHGIEPSDVRDAVVCRAGLSYVWDHHPQRGRRAILKLDVNRRPTLIVLYPAERQVFGDEYHLGSAYHL
jgi:hypothetical protein